MDVGYTTDVCMARHLPLLDLEGKLELMKSKKKTTEY
jgi:hypothetical protein